MLSASRARGRTRPARVGRGPSQRRLASPGPARKQGRRRRAVLTGRGTTRLGRRPHARGDRLSDDLPRARGMRHRHAPRHGGHSVPLRRRPTDETVTLAGHLPERGNAPGGAISSRGVAGELRCRQLTAARSAASTIG
ncbi:hypothetical protein RHCRD62_20406 [Rhodococcus sp. RD6.2]|nr:hypothetical protein RHCRD62_20406 [Rhodococcus sp. RD6.2]